MILMMMLTKITIITTIMFLSILIPDTEMEVLPFYANIAQESSGLSVGKDKTFSMKNSKLRMGICTFKALSLGQAFAKHLFRWPCPI